MTAADDLNLYLDTVLGDAEGYLHTATGVGGFFNENGNYKHKRWIENHYQWPAQRDKAVSALLAAAEESDAYACAYSTVADKRAEGAAVNRSKAHADCDGQIDLDKVRQIHGYAVGSGTDGHAHVYVDLTESVPAIQHEALCRGLGAYLGDADAKVKDNDVLRPPGTWNHKERARGGESTEVHWLIPPDGTKWDPEDLAAMLDITLPAVGSTNGSTGTRGAKAASTAAVTVDLDTMPDLKAEVDKKTDDRSKDTMRVVGACRDYGLTLDETRAVVASRPDLAGRLDERKDDDVLKCWLKVVDSRQTQSVIEVSAASLTPAAADTNGSEVIPGGAKYFNQAGLRARTLLIDCERHGPLASGIDGKVWAYADGVWVEGNRILRERVVALLGERYRRAHADTVESMVLARRPFINDTPALDYLNVINGLLDWRTGQLKPHTPEVPSTTRIPVRWNPEAACPNIDRFLGMVVGPECAPILEEVAGYALYPDQPLHKAVMLDGDGRNGKGTFLRILTALLGQENIAAAPPQRLDTDRWAVAQLYGKLANLVGDVDPRTFKETATFKQATGQDLLQGEHKYGAPFTFTSRALIVAAFNSLPRSVDTTEGFFSRWLVVPFPFRFADPGPDGELPPGCLPKDPDLGEKVTSTAELEGLLVRAVAGLQRVMAAGRFSRAQAVDNAEAEFRRHADPVRGFLAELAVGDAEGWISRAELHSSFKLWAFDSGLGALSAKRFTEKVREVHVEMFGYSASETIRTGSRGWSGIRLRADWDPVHEVHKVQDPLLSPLHTREKGGEGAPSAPCAPEPLFGLAADEATESPGCCPYCGRELSTAQAHLLGHCYLADCKAQAEAALR